MLLDLLRETSWIVYQPDKNLGLRASESEITSGRINVYARPAISLAENYSQNGCADQVRV